MLGVCEVFCLYARDPLFPIQREQRPFSYYPRHGTCGTWDTRRANTDLIYVDVRQDIVVTNGR